MKVVASMMMVMIWEMKWMEMLILPTWLMLSKVMMTSKTSLISVVIRVKIKRTSKTRSFNLQSVEKNG